MPSGSPRPTLAARCTFGLTALWALAATPSLAVLTSCGSEPASVPRPATSAAPAPAPADPALAEARERAAATLRACDAGGPLLAAWRHLSPEQLRTLSTEAGPWWMQAAWEAERVTLPPENGRARLDPAGVGRFTAQVERRLGVRPPNWWIATLRSGVVYSDTRSIYYDVLPVLPARYAARLPRGSSAIQVPPGTRLDDVPDAALATWAGPATHAEVLRSSQGVFVAAFDAGSGGFPFTVRRGDGGRVTWAATACTAGRRVLGGEGALVVEMIAAGSAVLVFSAETHGVALDVLEAERGDATRRFSSDLWMARQGDAG